MKKTLQNELKTNANEKVCGIVATSATAPTANANGIDNSAPETDQLVNNHLKESSAVVMDDVNFKYLKHVILKFLTSREVIGHFKHSFHAIGADRFYLLFIGRSATLDTSHWNTLTIESRRRTIATRNIKFQSGLVWIANG